MIVIAVLLLLCGWALLPKEGPAGERESALKLGLDLQGGMHLAVEIDDPDGTLDAAAKADAIDRTLTTIRNRIDEFGVREPTIQRVGDERIVVELAGIDDPERAKSIVERTAFLEFKIVRGGEEFRRALPRIDRIIVREIGPENLEISVWAGQTRRLPLVLAALVPACCPLEPAGIEQDHLYAFACRPKYPCIVDARCSASFRALRFLEKIQEMLFR